MAAVHPPPMQHLYSQGIPQHGPQSPLGVNPHYAPIRDQPKERQITHPNQPSTMSSHAKRGSVEAVYDNFQYLNARASQAINGVNTAGQPHVVGYQHMPGQQHMAFNVGGQNIPRTRQVSQDMGTVSPGTQTFAPYPANGYPMAMARAIPEEFAFQQVPFQPLRMPVVRRHTIDHPNQMHVRPPRVTFAPHPEVIDDSDESSDEEVFSPPPHLRPRHDSTPILRYVPVPGPIGSNPIPINPVAPIVMTGNPNVANPAVMQGNPMGMAGQRQGSVSIPPGHVQVIPQGQVVPMDIPTRPYSYMTHYRPGARYPSMINDLEILVNVVNPKNNNLKQFIGILAQRSPYELDALRYEFNLMTGGQDLQLVFNSLVAKEDEPIKSVITGLTLGPIAFDYWLLDGNLKKNMEDILIDIFVGRDPEDLRNLDLYYQHRHRNVMSGKSLASIVTQLTSSEELRCALMICTEGNKGREPRPVDQQRVLQDVEVIQKQLSLAFPSYQVIFDILLRRHDSHIAQINLYFSMREGVHLDEALRRNVCLNQMARNIAVHAVRTATDLTYRDCMLLRDAMGANTFMGNTKDEKLGIRICRMHWHRQHWKQIKAVYMGHMGQEFIDKCKKGRRGLFRDLVVSMAAA